MIKAILTLVLCLFTITLQSSKSKHKLPEFLTAKYPTKELVYQYANIISLNYVNKIIIYLVYMIPKIGDFINLKRGKKV